jgi:hypothetical protein
VTCNSRKAIICKPDWKPVSAPTPAVHEPDQEGGRSGRYRIRDNPQLIMTAARALMKRRRDVLRELAR